MVGQPVTLRVPVAMSPAISAKLILQSLERTALSSPPCEK
jgi:hypothetical protein